MTIKQFFDFEVRTGPTFLLTFAAIVFLVFKLKPSFDAAYLPFLILYTAHTGNRTWKELKTPAGTLTAAGAEEPKQ